MGKEKETDIGSAMWHRKINKEVEIAVGHALRDTDLLEPVRLNSILNRRIDEAITKAVSKIATPTLIERVVRKAFTKTDERHYVTFQAPPMLEGTIRQAILEEFNKVFDVHVQIKAEAQAGEDADAEAQPVRLNLRGGGYSHG